MPFLLRGERAGKADGVRFGNMEMRNTPERESNELGEKALTIWGRGFRRRKGLHEIGQLAIMEKL